MKFSRVQSVVGIAALSLIVAGCASGGGGGEPATSELTIGAILTLSGASSEYSAAAVAGAEQAISELNEEGGVEVDGTKYTLTLDAEDDSGKPDEGIAKLKKLDGDGVHFIIGAGFASVSTALITGIDRTSALITVPLGLVPESLLSEHPQAFQTQLSPEVQAAAAAWFFDKQGWKTLSMMNDSTSTFNSSVYPAALKAETDAAGIEIKDIIATQGPSQTDYSAALLAVENTNPDVMVASQTGAANALIVKQARQNGYTWPIYSTSGAPLLEAEVGGDAMDGTYDIVGMCLPTMVQDGIKQAISLNDTFKKANDGKDQVDPGCGYTNSYTAVYAYAAAMKAAGTTTDVEKLSQAMLGVKLADMPEITQNKYAPNGSDGTLFNDNHDAVTRAVILQWADGKPSQFDVYEGK